jgi:hypothetical protein
MTSVRVMTVASVAFVLGAQAVVAGELSRYRGYALESSVASVVKISGARESDARTLHERPATIRELEWRAPYVPPNGEPADPVHDVVFSFYDDQLYQMVVTYDRDRMQGLTHDDVIESIGAIYGIPLLRYAPAAHTPVAADVLADTTVLAKWENAASLLTLTKDTYSSQYQLVLISKTLSTQARIAINEARRLDTEEAPQRRLDERKREVADALAASQKARVVNKPAFRP